MTRKTNVCPLCGGTFEQLQFDPWNRWRCAEDKCWFHANPLPADTAAVLGRVASNAEWAADNGFWMGVFSAAVLVGAIAIMVWCLR